jgi:hypothetical protein
MMVLDEKLTKADYFIRELNSKNAKKIAFLLVLFFFLFHFYTHIVYGKFLHN